MHIVDVLRAKGAEVATIGPNATVTELLAGLAWRNIGAMVVVDDRGSPPGGEGPTVVGIVSERDIVRALHQDGPDMLRRPVSSIMTAAVATCGPDASVDDLTEVMTHNRVRHIPVLVDGRLVGIVSIGDVVKTRMDELQTERQQLQAYITQG